MHHKKGSFVILAQSPFSYISIPDLYMHKVMEY